MSRDIQLETKAVDIRMSQNILNYGKWASHTKNCFNCYEAHQ